MCKTIFLTFLFCCSFSRAGTESVESPIKPSEGYILTHPYVPLERDYSVEVGGMWERKALYWMGGSIGFNTGSCLFSKSQNCQGYFDITSGIGGRVSETHSLLLGSYRWQYIRFPSPWSPFTRVFAGSHVFTEHGQIEYDLASGVGFGVISYLHDKFDFRCELRIGRGRDVFAQAFIGAHLKIDQLVEFFAVKLKDLGIGAFGVTEKVIESTVDVTGKGLKGAGQMITTPFKGDKNDEEPSKDNSEKSSSNKDPKDKDKDK